MRTWIKVINPDGKVRFCSLGSTGVTLIGRHPTNRIVINEPGIERYHAVLHHRQKPYCVQTLRKTQLTFGEYSLTAHACAFLQPGDWVQIGNHTLVLLQDQPVISKHN